jgi:hypothetical protein
VIIREIRGQNLFSTLSWKEGKGVAMNSLKKFNHGWHGFARMKTLGSRWIRRFKEPCSGTTSQTTSNQNLLSVIIREIRGQK